MEITFDSYIRNPSNTRSRIVGAAEIARQTYESKFNLALLKVAGKIDYWLFKKPDDSRYILYIKIPSETIDKLTYDVCVEFYTRDDVNKKSNDLNGYYVKFFSNDPNFMFTYANVYNKNKLLIKDLISKYDPYTLKTKPGVTNANMVVGYVKSIYFAYLFYKLRGLDKKIMWANAPNINISTIQSMVMDCNRKVQQSQYLHKLKNSGNHIGDINDVEELKKKSTFNSSKVRYVKKVKEVSKGIQERQARNAKTIHIIKKTYKSK